MAENFFVGGGEFGLLLRNSFGEALLTHDWSQTSLGAVETWPDELKTAMQILLTELDQAKPTDKTQDDSATAALHQANQLNAFRVKLVDALRPLTDASEIQAIASRILGESLGASRVIYTEVVSGGQEVIVHGNYTNGVAQLKGRYQLEEYRRNLTADHQAGRTQVVTDIPHNPQYTDAQKARYHEIDIAAHIDVPLIKNNQFVALLAVHQSTPRQWTETEVKLVEETAERTWADVERAYAQTALRESEAKLQLALDAAKMGTFLWYIADDRGEPDAQMLALFGLPPDATLTLSEALTTLIHPGDHPSYAKAVARATDPAGDGSLSQEIRVVHPDGKVRWLAISAQTLFEGEPRRAVHMSGIAADITDRKLAQVALQRSEARLSAVAANLPNGAVFIVDQDLRYQLAAGKALEQAGMTSQDLVGKTIWEALAPELATNYEPYFRQALNGEPYSLEHHSHDREYASYGIPLFDAQGGVEAVLAVSYDITERKQAETALRESEEKYRTLFESIDQGFCVIEVLFDENSKPFDYRFLEVNPAFEKQTELINAQGKRIRELAPNHEEYWFEIYGDVALTGEPKRFENLAAALKRWYEVYAFRIGHPDERKVAVLFHDITERKLTEAALRQSEQRFRLMADVVPQQVWITDAQGNTQYVNQQWTTYTGLTLEQSQDINSTTQVIHPDDLENTSQLWRDALATGTPYQAEFRLQNQADNTYRWFLSRAIAIRDEQGNIVQWFGTSTDIEDFRRAQFQREQLLQREQAAREAAENANRIKDEFLAVLSHELRSPLNPILGWTRLLQNGKLDAVRQREALATIERNAKLLTQLIEDLLDISRIMRGKLSLTIAPVSLTFVISAAVETVQLAAEAKNIQIILDIAPGIAPVAGDVARLQQVVWNLLTNAVKFTPNGGQVTIELRQLDGLAQIRVIDTGKGINPQFLPCVFEYFRQEDSSTTRQFGGLGLGLAIARQIVEMHGGTLQVQSQGEGQGATFIVQLPTMQQTALSVPPSQPQTDPGLLLEGISILLVDDEPDTREFQAFVLKQGGAKVTTVASGSEALQALEKSIPDLLVSDIGMPQMDGYMLLEQIRSRPPHQGGMMPAIALTAYATETDQQRALMVGFNAHITKPVEPKELVRAIALLLPRGKRKISTDIGDNSAGLLNIHRPKDLA